MTGREPLPDEPPGRPPRHVAAATMAALIRAHALGDVEGVRVIVDSCDQRALIERLLEATMLLGVHRYGSREALAAAMLDITVWIATFAPEATS